MPAPGVEEVFPSISIEELIVECYKTAVSKGWWETPRSFGDMCALFHSEITEAFEEARNGHGLAEIYYDGDKPEGVPIELADVIIRIADLCGAEFIDIEEALRIKMAYNKTRPHRHGGKTV